LNIFLGLIIKMNKRNFWIALTIQGDKFDREIATSYIEQKSLGVFNSSDESIIYFKDIDKEEVENIVRLKSNINIFKWERIIKEDWNANWKPFFKKITINNLVEIIPSWEKSNLDSNKIAIKIDPGMAFGTGHHETTEMMIKAMLKFHKKDMSVLDVGTGSGILSILAHKLKSKIILAIDNDSEIVDNFNKNINLNNTKAKLKIENCLNMNENSFDLVLANINKLVLLQFLSKIKNNNSIIILSGFLKNDFEEMKNKINKIGCKIIKTYNKRDWLCFVIK